MHWQQVSTRFLWGFDASQLDMILIIFAMSYIKMCVDMCTHTQALDHDCVIGVFQTVLPSPETYCSVIMDMTYMWVTRYHVVRILQRYTYITVTLHLPKLRIPRYKSSIAIKALNVYIYCARSQSCMERIPAAPGVRRLDRHHGSAQERSLAAAVLA